jgi:hypothetical protein
MKITATVNYPNGRQVTQIWDFIPPDEERDEEGVLIIELRENGDIYGIVMDSSKIVPIKMEGLAANFNYSGSLKLEDAELIPRAGKSN